MLSVNLSASPTQSSNQILCLLNYPTRSWETFSLEVFNDPNVKTITADLFGNMLINSFRKTSLGFRELTLALSTRDLFG